MFGSVTTNKPLTQLGRYIPTTFSIYKLVIQIKTLNCRLQAAVTSEELYKMILSSKKQKAVAKTSILPKGNPLFL